jgi:uncharacterized protein (DUF983 family)
VRKKREVLLVFIGLTIAVIFSLTLPQWSFLMAWIAILIAVALKAGGKK